ncbi:outer membrane lipoprotein-sorting protein [bacterium]|nr:outer membrane lipoprotein-sorting protein [bacterium]
MPRALALVLLIAAAVFALPSHADERKASEIVDDMVSSFNQENMLLQLDMTLTNAKGQTRERKLRSRVKMEDKLGRTVISFEAPADVAGTKFLVVENKGRDDDQLLYLPALKRVRRIASSQKSSSFMGTDFSYYDLSPHDSEEGTHERLPDETVDGAAHYVVETAPKASTGSEYSKIKYWVRQDNKVVTKAEFSDKDGKLLKTMTVAGLEEYKPGLWIARRFEMKNVQKGTSTTVAITKYMADAKIADDYFTERFLKDESQL